MFSSFLHFFLCSYILNSDILQSFTLDPSLLKFFFFSSQGKLSIFMTFTIANTAMSIKKYISSIDFFTEISPQFPLGMSKSITLNFCSSSLISLLYISSYLHQLSHLSYNPGNRQLLLTAFSHPHRVNHQVLWISLPTYFSILIAPSPTSVLNLN